MMYIDTHAHLYHKQFDQDRAAMVERALEAGVERLYLPNIDGESIEAMHDMSEQFPGTCRMMMGLHPCSVVADNGAALRQVEDLLSTGRYHAVGEIGIDLHWDRTFLPQQQEVFREQLRLAKIHALPVAIHCRQSFAETIAIVEEEKDERLRGVFHCYTGPVEEGRRILELDGFFLGIGGVITFAPSGLSEVMAELGPERCVLETDAPYLAPVPFRGKRNESAYIPLVAQALAVATGRTEQEIAHITTRNAIELFGE